MTDVAPATMSDPDEPAALVVQHLSTVYGTSYGRIVAVRDVSFEIEAGEAVGIVGESGSGKTAIALALLGLLPRNGRIVDGEILTRRRLAREREPQAPARRPWAADRDGLPGLDDVARPR